MKEIIGLVFVALGAQIMRLGYKMLPESRQDEMDKALAAAILKRAK